MVPVDFKVERVVSFTYLYLYIIWEDSSTSIFVVLGGTSTGTMRVDSRTTGTGAGSATGPIWGVQERLFGIGTRVPCRHEFARLLFDQVSEQAPKGTEGHYANSKHGLH